MSAERFFDNLARTLAEPMPRRRAVRVIGASLAAVAIPGVSPRMARAATAARSQRPQCPRGELCCTQMDANGKVLSHEPCGYPAQQYQCVNYRCRDTCAITAQQTDQKMQATWSGVKFDDGRPQRYNCCPVPETIPRDGDCLPNCRRIGIGTVLCGRTCCPRGQRCKRPSTGECIPCPRRQEACGNTCCKSGKDCTLCMEQGSDYEQRSSDERRTGLEKCCAPDEVCCRNRCCNLNREHCCGSLCCPTATTRCAAYRGRDICCPRARSLRTTGGVSVCCPTGTVPVGTKGCCPPGDPNCCPPRDNLGGVLNCAGRAQICVRGNCVNP